jgi:Uma2 family endonuclease
MRVVMLDAPEELIAERHRLGLDHRDEVWEGEYHMVPPASDEHQRIGGRLFRVLGMAADDRGLEYRYEPGLYDPNIPGQTTFRVPDQAVFAAAHRSGRGIEGRAELVIEIRSPGDETYEKLPFYERVGVQEMLVIDRDTKALRHWVRHDDRLVEVDASSTVSLQALDARLYLEDSNLVVETAGVPQRI